MNGCRYLYNVNRIIVKPCYVDEYLVFTRQLDEYLTRNYGGYYAGNQLYRSKENCSEFFIVARYNDLFGLDKVTAPIQKYVEQQYDKTFGDNVIRKSVFSYSDTTRLYC